MAADRMTAPRLSPRKDPGPAYLASFAALGMALTFVGPALTTLRDQTGVSLAAVSVLFGAQAVGYVSGAVLSGRAYDAGLGHRLMAASLVIMAVAFVGVAEAGALPALVVLFALLGLGTASVDIGGNALLVWTRGDGVGPMMNALHFMAAVGALACPLLVNRSLAITGDLRPACWTGAAVALVVAVVVLRRDEPRPGGNRGADGQPPAPRALLALVSGFFLLYVGVELGFAGWVYAYAEDLRLGGADGAAWLTATFWAAFAIGRLLAIPTSAVVPPRALLLASGSLSVVAAALLVVADGGPMTWPATAALGLGLAPQFATMIAFAERHIAITGGATAWFIAASAIGGFVLPWLIGQLFDRTGSATMPIVILLGALATLGWFLLVARALGARDLPSVGSPVVPLLAEERLEFGG